jgi:hypothetical protein
MITSAIAVATDGRVSLGAGPTYGILLAWLFTHGLVCSAATKILARLNLAYVVVNGMSRRYSCERTDPSYGSQWAPPLQL